MIIQQNSRFLSSRLSSSLAAFQPPSSRQIHNHHFRQSPLQQRPLLLRKQQQQQQQGSLVFHPTTRSVMSSTSLAAGGVNGIPEFLTAVGPVKAIGSFVGVVSLLALLKYRNAIRRRVKQVREESWIFGAGVTMERMVDKNSKTGQSMKGLFSNLRLLELNPDFQAQCEKEGHNLISLGDYMAQLRPKGLPKMIKVEDTPRIIQREIEAGLAAGLLKVMGPHMGRALLPAVGSGFIQRKAQGFAGRIAANWFMDPNEQASISASNDKGGIPLSLMTVLAISDVNAKVNGGAGSSAVQDDSVPNFSLNAMDKMKVGEIVKGSPTFVQDLDDTFLIPNDFVVSRHFDAAVRGMEEILSGHDLRTDMTASTELLMAQDVAIQKEELHEDATAYKNRKGGKKKRVSDKENKENTYDPEDRSMGEPVPVNPRLFPGLHLGWGDALNSHTQREILKMRLFSIILNKLGANYYRRANDEDMENLFQLRMDDNAKPITTPWEFVQALMDAGHTVEVVPSSRMTTFGLALCVKEPDNSWTNVPMGVFLETGYEDREGNMAPAMMPHSGLDMIIQGPLAGNRADGTPSELRLQHFVGIEGFCGWKPHANAEVPFNESVERGARLSGDDAVRAARLSGLYATILNGLATELELPFGGYGLTAVCNDSAALVQQCLYGVNTVYPMTSIGRFMMRTMRYAQQLQDQLQDSGHDDQEVEVQELNAIIEAMKKIPSDINASPAGAESAATRLLATLQPNMPLRLMKDSKSVMESILREDAMDEVEEAGQAKKKKVERVESESDKKKVEA